MTREAVPEAEGIRVRFVRASGWFGRIWVDWAQGLWTRSAYYVD